MTYCIPYRLRDRKHIVRAKGPFYTYADTIDAYLEMRCNPKWEVHNPVWTDSLEEAIAKSKSSIGFFQEIKSGGSGKKQMHSSC